MKRKNKFTINSKALKIDKLCRMRDDLKEGDCFSITRLTVLKNIFQHKKHIDNFALFLATRTKSRIKSINPKYINSWTENKKLIADAATAIRKYLSKPRQASAHDLKVLLGKLEKIQGWEKNPYWSGPLRIINNRLCPDT